MKTVATVLFSVALLCTSAMAAELDEKFEQHVRTVLAEHVWVAFQQGSDEPGCQMPERTFVWHVTPDGKSTYYGLPRSEHEAVEHDVRVLGLLQESAYVGVGKIDYYVVITKVSGCTVYWVNSDILSELTWSTSVWFATKQLEHPIQ